MQSKEKGLRCRVQGKEKGASTAALVAHDEQRGFVHFQRPRRHAAQGLFIYPFIITIIIILMMTMTMIIIVIVIILIVVIVI